MTNKRIEFKLGDMTINEFISPSNSPTKLNLVGSIRGSYVSIESSNPATASYITSLIGNMNKVILINNIVVKSFDSDYIVGEFISWLADYEVVDLH